MRLPAPRSLAARLGILLVLAVVAAQAATFVMSAIETSRVGRAVGRTQVIDRVVTLVRLLDTVRPDEASGVIAAFGSPRHRFSIGADSIVKEGAMRPDEARLARRLDRRLQAGVGPSRLVLVERDSEDDPQEGGHRFKPDALEVSVRLADGRWLNGEAPLRLPLLPWTRLVLTQIAASVVAVVAVLGLALRGILRPIAGLATAAEQLGRGTTVEPLPENGPRELRRMSSAFNLMQARLRAFVDDRTRMLAAISHDLRTPIASLWLRAEMVEDAELRDAMVSTLADLRRMVDATLTFAREDATTQESEIFDLAGLVRSVVDDHRALGRDVSLSVQPSITFHGRPSAMRRAVDNLIENAVRYGKRARVTVADGEQEIRIRVDDDGPGIPSDRIEAMFEPFARLDGSRNDETGGTGLGLAIARSAARAHGGDVRLINRGERGLTAEVSLPTWTERLGGRV